MEKSTIEDIILERHPVSAFFPRFVNINFNREVLQYFCRAYARYQVPDKQYRIRKVSLLYVGVDPPKKIVDFLFGSKRLEIGVCASSISFGLFC